MKAKVIIENGESLIQLTPENEFEKTLIEDMDCMKKDYNIHASTNVTFNYGTYSQHRIDLSIKNR